MSLFRDATARARQRRPGAPMSTGDAGRLRRVLRHLRQVMAGSGTSQQRLEKLVGLIARELQAEVCSVYVMRAGEVLELFATEGLNPEAIHRTRLRVGEGVVGDIAAHARAMKFADVQSHPRFAYRPETGEEIYHSMMGVPILRGGRVRGVLVLQNRIQRDYAEDEIEALEVIATVLAELIAGGDLIGSGENLPTQGNAVLPVRLTGVPINGGVGMGEAVLHQPRVPVPRMFTDDPDAEQERLIEAVASMHSALDDLLAASEIASGGEHRDVLETYRLIAREGGWLKRMREAIGGGLTAEAAVQKEQDDARARMSHISDPYLRERLSDIEDMTNRLMQHLAGAPHTAAAADLPDDVVLLARSMGPAELLDYEPWRLRALLLEEGSASSHVAIVARALDIPVIGRVKGLLSGIDPFDPVIVDADNAQVFVRPGDDILQMVANNSRLRAARRRAYAAQREEPSVTRDGVRVSLNLNAGLLIDMQHIEETGVDGVGLFRTEIPFMVRAEFPSVAAQTELYRLVLDQAGGRPVMFRTLDIGGDKRLPYFDEVVDENPVMGWRAVRVALDRPAMLRQQLRALIRAARGGGLSVMFPMVSEIAEFDVARAIFDKELDRERGRGNVLPYTIRIGAMMEVPALMWQFDALLSRVDFVSVGSNDLFQFMFASDRGNPRVAGRYDVLSPGFLALLRAIAERCRAANVPVSLCGEMAGEPLEAMTLVGLGYRIISMPPSKVGAVKAMTRTLAVDSLASYLDTLLPLSTHSLRQKLQAYARDHGVAIEAG